MNNEDDDDLGRPRVLKFILIGIVLASLLWINYCHFTRHISSNPERINHFVAKDDNMDKFRAPAVAGVFYPADTENLDAQVGKYLSDVTPLTSRRPKMLIVPHAGYRYSAPTAAKAYGLLRPYAKNIRNVILVGPSHYVAVDGFALSGDDYFKTPLGQVPVNKEINAELAQNPHFKYNSLAHLKEHSLEVQLPFLQKVLKRFSIVPVVYGNADPAVLAAALQPYMDRPDTLIIFSADLSHYYTYDQARYIDSRTEELVAGRLPQVEEHMSCGSLGINAAVLLARKYNFQPRLLDIVNSGDVTGDKSGVVGYGAWSFDREDRPREETALPPLKQEVESLRSFAEIYGKDLLEIAGASLKEAVGRKKYKPSRSDYPNELFNRGASFVTLQSGGELRGCIGSLLPGRAIADDVADNAYKAAVEDSRFAPLTEEELKNIKVSISLLSGFEAINYKDEADLLSKIIQGVDGIVIRDGNRQGVFLPAVWKQLPDKAEFLNNLKIKAGMSPSYWSNRIKVYRFRVVEISKDEN